MDMDELAIILVERIEDFRDRIIERVKEDDYTRIELAVLVGQLEIIEELYTHVSKQ